MRHQNPNDSSEESRFYEREEAIPKINHEKLNSFWYVIFKYWMLLAALWGLKELISLSSSGIDRPVGIKLEFSTFDKIRNFINSYPVRIWEIINCALVFEGLRRKNLKILVKVITSMEAYMAVNMVLTFFSMTSDAGLAIAKSIFADRFPDFKLDKYPLSFFAVIIVLIWASFYYFVNLYGTKKARDVLKGRKDNSRSL